MIEGPGLTREERIWRRSFAAKADGEVPVMVASACRGREILYFIPRRYGNEGEEAVRHTFWEEPERFTGKESAKSLVWSRTPLGGEGVAADVGELSV